MSGWRKVQIADIGQVFDGPHATPKTVDEGPVFLGIPSLNSGRLDLAETRHVTEEDFLKWTKRVTPTAGDIVFSYETKIGEAALIPDGLRCCLGRRMGLVRLDPTKCDPRYFLYQYISPDYQRFLASRTVHGATVDRLLLKNFPFFEFPLPTLAEQREIASILGALDDKIELNRRMAATLEEMARALYRSWFVDFDPVKAKAEGLAPAYMDETTAALFPDRFGDDGLPEGWRMMRFDEVANLKNGYAFKSSDWSEEGIPVIKIGSIKPALVDTHSGSFVESSTARGKEAFRASAGSALIGLTGYVGEVGRVPPCSERPLVNQRVARIDPKNGCNFSAFIYTIARTPEFKEFVVGKSYGSAQANVSTKDILSFIFVGAEEIIKDFDKGLQAAFDRQLFLHGENQVLADLRDSLLPKLMSGELRVGEARDQIEEVA